MAKKISGHKSDSTYRRYNIVSGRDIEGRGEEARGVFEEAGMMGTNIESIRRALEPYVGKPARIVWDDGTAEVLTIVSVDDEGFVYELIPPDEVRYYWNRHEEVTSVG